MTKITNYNQLKDHFEQLQGHHYTFNELLAEVKEQSDLVQSIIFWMLEFKDEARSKHVIVREDFGEDYFNLIENYLHTDFFDLLIERTPKEYIELRSSENKSFNCIATEYIAPILKNYSTIEKYSILKSVVKDKITCSFFDCSYDMSPIQMELFQELDISPIVIDDKTKMAMEYSEESVPLVLDFNESYLLWRLESKVVAQVESFWDSVKSTVVSLTKNTVGNPTFRKYAVAGIALGVAVVAADANAGLDIKVFDLDGVKEYFTSIDEYFNENVLPKYGFNDGCEVSSKIVSQSATEVSAEITIGDRKILIDVQSSVVEGKGFAHGSAGVKMEVVKMPNVKSSCNMDKDTYINLAKSISKQLSSFKR